MAFPLIHLFFLNVIQISVMTTIVGLPEADSILCPAMFPIILAILCLTILGSYKQVSRSMWKIRSPLAVSHISSVYRYCSNKKVGIHGRRSRQSKQECSICRRLRLSSRKEHRGIKGDIGLDFGFGFLLPSVIIPIALPSKWRGAAVLKEGSRASTFPGWVSWLDGPKNSLCYLIMDILKNSGQPENNHKVHSLDLIPFLDRPEVVTAEQLAVRAITTVAMYVSIYCIVNLMRSIVAFFSVISGLTGVEAWRPLYGPLTEAYTIRRFWG